MSKLIKMLFGAYVLVAVIAAFPAVAVPAVSLADVVKEITRPKPNIEQAVIKGAALIDGLNAGILGGPARTIEVQAEPADDFTPNAILRWGCWQVEDVVEVLRPVREDFVAALRRKLQDGTCFFAPGQPFAVERLEKMTRIPAEGDRPEGIIWSVRDSQGTVAYGVWSPDTEN